MEKSFTILIAHPDDEILWMWPALIPGKVKKIVCLSSDVNNPQRQWCRERGKCLQEIGDRLQAPVHCFPHNSEFYRLPTRDGTLKKLAQEATRLLEGPVFTHNAWGEYGHIDHILCHHIAVHSGQEVWSTDIAWDINWLPINPGEYHDDRRTMTRELFNELKRIYDARGCWTWSFDPVLECGVKKL